MSWEEIGLEGDPHSSTGFAFQSTRVVQGSSLVSGEGEESDSSGVHRGRQTDEGGRVGLDRVGSQSLSQLSGRMVG